jgi:hypothetical protein
VPAYNAEKTIARTYEEVVAQEIVATVVIVEDKIADKTASVAESLKRGNANQDHYSCAR